MNPFTGEGWEGWLDRDDEHTQKCGWTIWDDGELWRWNKKRCTDGKVGAFQTPEAARAIVELIEAAEAGKPIPTLKDVAELVELPAELTGWQPIETAPKDKPVFVGNAKWSRAHSAVWNPNFGVFASSSHMKIGITMYTDATHWQPLPEPPKETTE